MKHIIVGGVIIQDGKILLIQESAPEFRGQWDLPAGELDDDENLIAGAIREVREETGLDVEPENLLLVQNSVNPQAVRFFFDMKIIGGETKFDGSEISNVKWFPLSEIEKLNLRIRLKQCWREISRRHKAGENYPLDLINDLAEVKS